MPHIVGWLAIGCKSAQSSLRRGAFSLGDAACANLQRVTLTSPSRTLHVRTSNWLCGTEANQRTGSRLWGCGIPTWQRQGENWRYLCGAGRFMSTEARRKAAQAAREAKQRAKNRQLGMYMGGVTLFAISFTYISVPLYRVFCQKTGFAGTVKRPEDVQYEQLAHPVSGKRVLTIKFNADVSDRMPWKFQPQQHEVKVLPGEAALCFFTAQNRTNDPIIGVSSYNVTPDGAALYFNKIQCFCFEEQLLKAREKIDMPVFFFIDPAFLEDKAMTGVDTITLSYTFFRAGDPDAPEIAGMLDPHPVRHSSRATATV